MPLSRDDLITLGKLIFHEKSHPDHTPEYMAQLESISQKLMEMYFKAPRTSSRDTTHTDTPREA